MKATLLLLAMLIPLFAKAENRIRSVNPKPDQIIEIRTALGIATMIQSDAAPSPAISGDQSGFRIEYFDKSTIVKPLRFGAKTNLFLVTNAGRYNLRLVTGSENIADYVVYIKPPNTPNAFQWFRFSRVNSNNLYRLEVARVGKGSDGQIVVEGSINSKRAFEVSAANFWVKQGGVDRIIDEVYLEDSTVASSSPMKFYLAISKSDFDLNRPLQLVFTPPHEPSVSLQLDGVGRL